VQFPPRGLFASLDGVGGRGHPAAAPGAVRSSAAVAAELQQRAAASTVALGAIDLDYELALALTQEEEDAQATAAASAALEVDDEDEDDDGASGSAPHLAAVAPGDAATVAAATALALLQEEGVHSTVSAPVEQVANAADATLAHRLAPPRAPVGVLEAQLDHVRRTVHAAAGLAPSAPHTVPVAVPLPLAAATSAPVAVPTAAPVVIDLSESPSSSAYGAGCAARAALHALTRMCAPAQTVSLDVVCSSQYCAYACCCICVRACV
jgi:hypothetical protein